MLPAQVREDILDHEANLKLSTGKKLSTAHKESDMKKDEKSNCLRHSLSTGWAVAGRINWGNGRLVRSMDGPCAAHATGGTPVVPVGGGGSAGRLAPPLTTRH